MFSRRALRVKAMQYLFAFFVQKNAIDSMTVVHGSKLDSVAKQQEANLQYLKRGLVQELAKIKNLFIHFLQLFVAWTQIDQEKDYGGSSVFCGTLSQNHLLQRLKNHAVFSLIKPPITWPQDLAKRWYDQVLKEHAVFKTYTSQSSHTHKEDRDLVVHIIKKIIFKHKHIQKHASSEDICWAENKLIVQRLLLDFVEKLTESTSIPSSPYNVAMTTEEEIFYDRLVEKVIENEVMYESCIATRLKNWKLSRIMFLDKLLIKMALTEVMDFAGIPKSVAINEYLDIAKKYSSPKSHIFINGMLEALVDELATKV